MEEGRKLSLFSYLFVRDCEACVARYADCCSLIYCEILEKFYPR